MDVSTIIDELVVVEDDTPNVIDLWTPNGDGPHQIEAAMGLGLEGAQEIKKWLIATIGELNDEFERKWIHAFKSEIGRT